MRKIFFGFLAFFALALAPSAYGVGLSDPTTLVDQTITAEEASNYHVEVPQDLDPGFYQMNIELYDSSGVLKTQTIRLCKNLNGEVDWSASCPDLVPVYSLESINNIENRSDLPVYSALMEPKKQMKNIIAALASVSLVVTGANTLTQQAPARKPDDSSQQGTLEAVDDSDLEKTKDEEKWGDRSWTYRLLPGYKAIDKFFDRLPLKIDRVSPLVARAMCDGDYLRAIIGTFILGLYAVAITGGVYAALSVNRQALPPSWTWAAILAVIGVFDSFAGILAAFIYFGSVLMAGHIHTISEFLTVFATSMLFFSPPLIACAIRQFRRETTNSHEVWELITDFALAPLLGGWSAQKILSGMEGFAKVQLPISHFANKIGVIVGIAIFVRIFIENGAVRLYSKRMVDVHTQFEDPHIFQRITSLLIKTVIFYYLSGTFIGFSPFLIAGTILFALPSAMGIFIGNKLPRSTRLYRLLPTGTVLAIFLIFAGYFITAYIHSHITNTLTFFSWTFVGVLIPVFIFQIADFFIIDKVDHWKESGRFYTLAWRAGGTAVYVVLVLIVFGVDIPGYLKTLIVG